MTVVKLNNKPANGFSLFDNFFNEIPTLFRDDFASYQKDFVPVNVKEIKDGYEIEVVAPGFEKNDFKINLEKGVLTISGEKKDDVKTGDEKQIRNEYKYRSFKRSFTLDEKIDAEKIDAKYLNGILTLSLPKKEEVKTSAKEISIQ